MSQDQSQGLRDLSPVKFAEDLLSQWGLDRDLVVRALIIAIVSGIVAALADEALRLPARVMVVTMGGMVGALNGTTYAVLKRCVDRYCVGMGIFAGWLATMTWFLTLEIIAAGSIRTAQLDWFEATITGLVAGALGLGWYAAVLWRSGRASS